MEIKELIKKSHQISLNHGWWDEGRMAKESILMIIVELCEAIQKDRNYDSNGFNEEIADVWIRLADLTGFLDIDLEKEIEKKMTINKDRPYKHNRKY